MPATFALVAPGRQGRKEKENLNQSESNLTELFYPVCVPKGKRFGGGSKSFRRLGCLMAEEFKNAHMGLQRR